MSKTQDLIDEAISLPIEERALLVDSLLRSMNPLDEKNEKKWAAEAKRRLEELRAGEIAPVSGEEVFKKIWKVKMVKLKSSWNTLDGQSLIPGP
jgi:putative addiction module component (TIGR02574 family)